MCYTTWCCFGLQILIEAYYPDSDFGFSLERFVHKGTVFLLEQSSLFQNNWLLALQHEDPLTMWFLIRLIRVLRPNEHALHVIFSLVIRNGFHGFPKPGEASMIYAIVA